MGGEEQMGAVNGHVCNNANNKEKNNVTKKYIFPSSNTNIKILVRGSHAIFLGIPPKMTKKRILGRFYREAVVFFCFSSCQTCHLQGHGPG